MTRANVHLRPYRARWWQWPKRRTQPRKRGCDRAWKIITVNHDGGGAHEQPGA